MSISDTNESMEAIAIIGIAGRFPSAKSIDEFWQNLQSGVESISDFTDKEVISDGIDAVILNDPNYVKASAILENIDLFDASFFSFNAKEAEVTDPQHRLFWSALGKHWKMLAMTPLGVQVGLEFTLVLASITIIPWI